MQEFKSLIQSIVQEHGHEGVTDMKLGDSVQVESQEFEDLSIEKIAESRLAVMQSYLQHHDVMRDPEVVFDLREDTWIPIEYRQDPHLHRYDESGLSDLDGFLNSWAENLRNQGFAQSVQGESDEA